MTVKPIGNIEAFSLAAEPLIGVFASSKWLSIYNDNLSLAGIYNNDDKLIGGFFYYSTRKFGFTFIKLPPYTPHCGMFFHSANINRASLNSFSKEVMNVVCEYITRQVKALTVLAFPSQITDLQPFIWEKYKVIPNYTYRIDLTQELGQIKANFDPKNRNVINKAVRENVFVEENKISGQDLYKFFSSSLQASGANVYTSELKNIFLSFADKDNSFSLAAMKDGELAGVVFCIFDSKSCYYLLGGVNKSAGLQGINNLLIQQSIEKAKGLGCKIFDFEGSMLKGVEKFFRSFGGELVPYYTINKAKLPVELLLKFKKRELF